MIKNNDNPYVFKGPQPSSGKTIESELKLRQNDLYNSPSVYTSKSKHPLIWTSIQAGKLSGPSFVQSRTIPLYNKTIDIQRISKLLTRTPQGLKFQANHTAAGKFNTFAKSKLLTFPRFFVGFSSIYPLVMTIPRPGGTLSPAKLSEGSRTMLQVKTNLDLRKRFLLSGNPITSRLTQRPDLLYSENLVRMWQKNRYDLSPTIKLSTKQQTDSRVFKQTYFINNTYSVNPVFHIPKEMDYLKGRTETGNRTYTPLFRKPLLSLTTYEFTPEEMRLVIRTQDKNQIKAYNSLTRDRASYRNPFERIYGFSYKENVAVKKTSNNVQDVRIINDTITSKVFWEDTDEEPKDIIKFVIKDILNNKKLFFRTTISGLNESVQAGYQKQNYSNVPIGGSVYENTSRTLTFNIRLYSQNVYDLEANIRKLNYLTSLTFPNYNPAGFMIANFTEITIGTLYYKQPCLITSINKTFDDNTPWEIGRTYNTETLTETALKVTDVEDPSKSLLINQFPHVVDVTLSFDLLEKRVPNQNIEEFTKQFHGRYDEV